ncbi:MAG: DUF222 domain-containing protein [Actinobacteria bacterium]|nr:DUF222 domain-containing protein [Actinomycetota bacterium]
MASFDAITALIPTLSGRVAVGASAADVQAMIVGLDDAGLVSAFGETAELSVLVEQVQAILAGVIHARSSWQAGHAGLAQGLGHRNAASLVQELSGVSKAEASRQVRVGDALLEEGAGDGAGGGASGDAGAADDTASDAGDGSEDVTPVSVPWHEPLRAALRAGRLTSAQFDAIRLGLGEPPAGAEDAWSTAAAQLVEEAARRTVEELLAHARCVRDVLDPVGAEQRSQARFERRAFRTWLDQDGIRRGSIAFDDEGGVFLESVFAAALRPRRGGPRFVDEDEKTAAADLAADTRTNDQLGYDLLLDIVRAGVLADAASVFGTRQAGIRLVQTITPGGVFGPAVTEDGLTVLPAHVADRRRCETGTITLTVDAWGNPLDVGREHRLSTPRQRIGLAIRDGGCRWPGCDRPASYCEAHHIDEWHRDHGHTNTDRGILLCRFHHTELHHNGWRITRHAAGDFILHTADGTEIPLTRRLPLRYLFTDIDPPPKRFRPAA